MDELTTQEEVQYFVNENPIAVIFKAGKCRQTEEALKRLTPFFKQYPGIPAAMIDVVDHRDASSMATSLSGKKHESPQLLLFKNENCVFESNHWRIEAMTLIEAVKLHFKDRNA